MVAHLGNLNPRCSGYPDFSSYLHYKNNNPHISHICYIWLIINTFRESLSRIYLAFTSQHMRKLGKKGSLGGVLDSLNTIEDRSDRRL